MNRSKISRASTWLNEWFLLVLIIAHPADKKSFVLFGGRLWWACNGFDLACEETTRIKQPQLIGWEGIPEACEKPKNDSNFHHSEHDIIPVSRLNGYFLLPEVAEHLARKKTNNYHQHNCLWEQPNTRLMHLRCIDIHTFIRTSTCRWQGCTIVSNKTTTNFEENLNAIDKKEYDNDEEENCIRAVKDAVKKIFIGEKFRW